MKNKNFSIVIVAIMFLVTGLILGKYLPSISKNVDQEGLSIKSVSKPVGVRQPNGSILFNSSIFGSVSSGNKHIWRCPASGTVLQFLLTQNNYPNGTGINIGGVNVACAYVGYVD